MEEMCIENSAKKKYVVWISRTSKHLSFHAIPKFEAVSFTSHEEMWETVHYYVDAGYLVE